MRYLRLQTRPIRACRLINQDHGQVDIEAGKAAAINTLKKPAGTRKITYRLRDWESRVNVTGCPIQ